MKDRISIQKRRKIKKKKLYQGLSAKRNSTQPKEQSKITESGGSLCSSATNGGNPYKCTKNASQLGLERADSKPDMLYAGLI